MTVKITKIIEILLIIFTGVFAASLFMSNREVFGQYRIYSVMSGSMSPALFTGSLVAVRSYPAYSEGDIVTFISESRSDGTVSRDTVTHRIVKVGENTYLTRGDANDTDDPFPISRSQVIGKVVFSLPLLGFPVSFAKSTVGFITLLVIPGLVIIGLEIKNIYRELKMPKKAKKRSPAGIKKPLILLIMVSISAVSLTQSYYRQTVSLSSNVFSLIPKPITLDFFLREDKKAVGFRIWNGNLSEYTSFKYSIVYDTANGSSGVEGEKQISGQSDITVNNLLLGSCSSGGTCSYDTGISRIQLEIVLSGPDTVILKSSIDY